MSASTDIMMQETCQSCRYRTAQPLPNGQVIGICRRFPPQLNLIAIPTPEAAPASPIILEGRAVQVKQRPVALQSMVHYPQVEDHMPCCGEFMPRESDKSKQSANDIKPVTLL